MESKIIQIIRNRIDFKDRVIELNDKFTSDLEMNDLDSIELIMDIEKYYNIKIPDFLAEKIETPKELILLVDYIKNPNQGKPLFLFKKYRRSPDYPILGCPTTSVNNVFIFVFLMIVIGAFTGTTLEIFTTLSPLLIVSIISIAIVTMVIGYYQVPKQTGKVLDTSQEKVENELLINENTIVERVQINISGGQLGNLNLGEVSGNLNAKLSYISNQCGDEIAESLKEFTEAIVKSQDLSNETKESVVENIGELANQLTVSDKERKPVVIKSLITSISSILSKADKIIPIWDKTVEIIEQIFS